MWDQVVPEFCDSQVKDDQKPVACIYPHNQIHGHLFAAQVKEKNSVLDL